MVEPNRSTQLAPHEKRHNLQSTFQNLRHQSSHEQKYREFESRSSAVDFSQPNCRFSKNKYETTSENCEIEHGSEKTIGSEFSWIDTFNSCEQEAKFHFGCCKTAGNDCFQGQIVGDDHSHCKKSAW